ncbi:Lysylphosphatidylglycerol biosynthesis bifunctional protein LysX [Actinomadura rubteroloni]|uniref:Lysylphosphatidylglycerol biosynthesis bifunctional protein LysX n=1 Tax=Actinomadura rubteroloni TaxID=1926885 RepID=A0A2P4UHH5_9ACTN|nr:phosphatidylglycerol lysyltransferase domain-containing protein [Actinomadura rubteroloni]POM24466.1 Lysylphosphatidylglycerol biosynthesis bifunctional protein LysX [Actinomadura rubteroloni]
MERAKPPGPVWPAGAGTGTVAVLLAVPAVPDSPGWLRRASVLVTGEPLAPAHAVVLALALLLVARGILLRRRAALAGVLALIGLGLVAVLAGDDAPWRGPLLAAVLVALWLRRADYPVRPHPARVRTAAVVGGALIVGTALGAVLVGGVAVGSVGRDLASGLGATGAHIEGADWLPGVLATLGGAGLLALVLTLLAPDPAPAPGDDAERRRVALLVAHSGSDTLAPFALRRDKSYVFSPDGRAAIGYRVLFGIAAAGGDPVGDPASHRAAIAAFLELCRTSGWRPAVLGARPELVPAWDGLRAIGVGDEVLLRPAGFALTGRRMRNVRQAVQRSVNAGVTTEVLAERDLSPGLRGKLLDVARSSLGGAAERGFSMNLDELLTGRHPGTVVAVAYDRAGEPVGFQRYARAGNALSLDAMRRRPGGPNGVNERLIAETLAYAADRGLDVVSLNFAAFRTLLETEDRNPLERAGYRAIHLLDPWIAVESLFLFNRKFRPDYQPRCVLFRAWTDLVPVAAALLALEFGRTRPGHVAPVPEPEPAGRLGHL